MNVIDVVTGYVAGLSGSCDVECPGGFKNACSGRGRCVASHIVPPCRVMNYLATHFLLFVMHVRQICALSCVGAVAPVEGWETTDGAVNSSYVKANDTNLSDTRQSEEVTCICDEGYVGPSCEFECPGWNAPWNRPQRLCSGYNKVANKKFCLGCVCDCLSSLL